MTTFDPRRLFHGDAVVHEPRSAGDGQWVERDGERFYRIANYHAMPPFMMYLVGAHDHWSFVSSTGGLTCGRREPGNALFPYCTDDKLHDASETTGPKTLLRVDRGTHSVLWQPFDRGSLVYEVERNLYKNIPGNKLVFEEINRDLELAFRYTWSSGRRFGFIRKSELFNTGRSPTRVAFLDGIRNVLPYGVELTAQSELSTLVDAYKQAETVRGLHAGIYSLGALLTDRAEPSEALKATIVWSLGLDHARILLSEEQVPAFRRGREVVEETLSRGRRGAFFVAAASTLEPGSRHTWYVLADVEQGPSRAAGLIHAIRRGVSIHEIDEDIEEGTARLEKLAGGADGFQQAADDLVTARHFSNTLFNIMRGGVFPYGYRFPREDFLDFAERRNRRAFESVRAAVAELPDPLTLDSMLEAARARDDDDFTRLVYEYLPLTFSRRHGDPSRPWNRFSIRLDNGHGTECLYYEGNWRDVFQNWEALALSFPNYLDSFIAKFVNASTPDGHNPYRISREGIDWEVPEPSTPWSNIGYWGDHQVGYLLRLLELSRQYHPESLAASLTREIYVFADVPYRIKPYDEILKDPRKTVSFDDAHARTIDRRVAEVGADGKLVTLPNGAIHRANLLEKLLIAGLARIGSLVPGGGIWMNTQRPEWNDANNALVGYGVSMVTLCHSRRYLRTLDELIRSSEATRFDVSEELAVFFEDVHGTLRDHAALLSRDVDAASRKTFMDRMGPVCDRYRAAVYRGHSGAKRPLAKDDLLALLESAAAFVDHSISLGRREDGLFHSYNLVRFDPDGYVVEPLDEMLEGQVAVVASGYLDTREALALLEALPASRLYHEDRRSYTLYPDRKLPSFLEKNVIPASLVEADPWIREELEAGRTRYIERDVHGQAHFAGEFRNVDALRAALATDASVSDQDGRRLCETYEAVFAHRRYTGRSGSMFKYEGLGCIYWHMVSKLLLVAGEVFARAVDEGEDRDTLDRLRRRFREIRAGLGVRATPAEYGAFPIDPYSHTPGFTGAQQPGMTGQVKEDITTRLLELGVRIVDGRIEFRPVLLTAEDFLPRPRTWRFSVGERVRTEALPAGSLGFTLCGVAIVYRLSGVGRVHVFSDEENAVAVVDGSRLTLEDSRSIFRREFRIRKLVVDVPESSLAGPARACVAREAAVETS